MVLSEEVKAKHKKYNQRPEVKAIDKEYQKKYRELMKKRKP